MSGNGIVRKTALQGYDMHGKFFCHKIKQSAHNHIGIASSLVNHFAGMSAQQSFHTDTVQLARFFFHGEREKAVDSGAACTAC